jgi:hypothetical protein
MGTQMDVRVSAAALCAIDARLSSENHSFEAG